MPTLPHTKYWKAWEDRQPPALLALHVTGEVETGNSNQSPHLKEAVPQGINPTILILNLSLTASGAGTTMMGWKHVRFDKSISREHYASVDIHWDGESIAKCKVEVVH